MPDNDIRQSPTTLPINCRKFYLGFEIAKAEDGGWVLSDFNVHEGRNYLWVCADDEALFVQMRAWTERQIEKARQYLKEEGNA